MTSTYDQEVDNIDSWLLVTTSDMIRQSVLMLLRIFREERQFTKESCEHLPLVLAQHPLGCQAFYAGVWHTSWLTLQETFHQSARLQRSASHWLIQLLQKIQRIPLFMWHIQNDILHSTHDNHQTQARNAELDMIVDFIFSKKPHARLMSYCDNIFFKKHSTDKVKKMKIRRKTTWITGANLILTKYERSLTEQSARFVSFFQWDDGG
jgi:hypothetical protein